ncbi:TetR/AcrR family transcriptional regulator [Aminobacter sp. BE322]|uniref:TetR/AcrR family transcriptional regulator n=1 Tax=unclassified Aminobacter TaxID=2644704 RepID=UPI003D24D6D0
MAQMDAGGNGTDTLDRDGLARAATNPRKELVREQLIDIAAELFDSKGYAQTSINDIAQALGLGRSAVYHYFRNKEEMLAALVESEALTPSHRLQELMEEPGLSASERLRRAIVDGIVRRLSSGSRFILLSRLETQIPEALGPIYNQGRRHIYDFYVRCISDGIASGEFRTVDPKVTAFAVIGMANWTSRWYSPSGAKTPMEIGEIIADMALAGLRAHDDRPRDAEAVRQTIAGLRLQIDELEKLVK